MNIHGWIRTSLIDYADHIATAFFTGGCNFRCPMCHNADLVLRPGKMPAFAMDEIWAFLTKRVGKITGVVVSGGEPTLQPGLIDFLRRARDIGYAIKLDTNGYRPDVLRDVLTAGLVDYVAMDLKAPPEKYPLLAGFPDLDIARIEQSVALLVESPVPHEFRTTVVPGLLNVDDIAALARWLASNCSDAAVQRLYLQQFRGLKTLSPALMDVAPYAVDVLHTMADRARQYVPHVALRGV